MQAPSEAEAQCCAMCKEGMVYGVATDDMDALTFGTPKLIRHLMAPGNNQKLTIDEFDMATILEQMELSQVWRCALLLALWRAVLRWACLACGSLRIAVLCLL